MNNWAVGNKYANSKSTCIIYWIYERLSERLREKEEERRERDSENIVNLSIVKFSVKHQKNEPVAKGLWNSDSGKRVIWAYDNRVLLDVMRCLSSSAIFERFVYKVALVIEKN